MHAFQLHVTASTVHFYSAFSSLSVPGGDINPQLIFFSDEALIHLLRYISMQNNSYWGSQNLHLTQEVFL